jgi:hypothetical protein
MKFKMLIKGSEHLVDLDKKKIINLKSKHTRELSKEDIEHFNSIKEFHLE